MLTFCCALQVWNHNTGNLRPSCALSDSMPLVCDHHADAVCWDCMMSCAQESAGLDHPPQWQLHLHTCVTYQENHIVGLKCLPVQQEAVWAIKSCRPSAMPCGSAAVLTMIWQPERLVLAWLVTKSSLSVCIPSGACASILAVQLASGCGLCTWAEFA